MQKLRNALHACDDGCPNQHYTKSVARGDSDNEVVDLQDHPLVCFNDGGCGSQLSILRAASTHHGVLRTLLNHVHSAIASHLGVLNIDKDLRTGDLHALMEVTKVRDFAGLLANDLDSRYEQCAPVAKARLLLRNVKAQLLLAHAQVIVDFEKEVDDHLEHAGCSCEHLHQRKSVTRVRLSDNLGSSIWPALKAFILERNLDANDQVLYMCKHCKPLIKRDNLPARCILNGLETVPMSPELANWTV